MCFWIAWQKPLEGKKSPEATMTAYESTTVNANVAARGKHPRGLYILFATEMWERFGFYSLQGMLTLYLRNAQQGFGWTAAQATTLYSSYLMLVYGCPLLGGWLADRFIGYSGAITLGGILLAAGYFLLSLPSTTALYGALAVLVIGNGFFKPNISTMVGNLYPQGSPLRDSAFSIFYMGINIGAFIAPVVAETVWQRHGFRPAFAVAGGGMMVSLLIFLRFKRWVGNRQNENQPASAEQCGNRDHGRAEAIEAVPDSQRILALVVIFALVIVFWMIFYQNGATLTFWANDNTDWTLAPMVLHLASLLTLGTVRPDVGNVSGVISNAINPFWIVVFTFPLVAFWKRLAKRGLEPSTPSKMAVGMVFTAVSFYLMGIAALSGGNQGKVSPWWLIGAYALISLGELMLSPMGLSLVSKVAPTRMRGLMMGAWFAATAIGSKLSVIGVYWEVWKHSDFFFLLATLALFMSGLLLMMLKPLKKAMPGM
jgi:POT family proton-dependent oligopeptide transporter